MTFSALYVLPAMAILILIQGSWISARGNMMYRSRKTQRRIRSRMLFFRSLVVSLLVATALTKGWPQPPLTEIVQGVMLTVAFMIPVCVYIVINHLWSRSSSDSEASRTITGDAPDLRPAFTTASSDIEQILADTDEASADQQQQAHPLSQTSFAAAPQASARMSPETADRTSTDAPDRAPAEASDKTSEAPAVTSPETLVKTQTESPARTSTRTPGRTPSAAPARTSPETLTKSPSAAPARTSPETPTRSPSAEPTRTSPETLTKSPSAAPARTSPETLTKSPNAAPDRTSPETLAKAPTPAPAGTSSETSALNSSQPPSRPHPQTASGTSSETSSQTPDKSSAVSLHSQSTEQESALDQTLSVGEQMETLDDLVDFHDIGNNELQNEVEDQYDADAPLAFNPLEKAIAVARDAILEEPGIQDYSTENLPAKSRIELSEMVVRLRNDKMKLQKLVIAQKAVIDSEKQAHERTRVVVKDAISVMRHARHGQRIAEKIARRERAERQRLAKDYVKVRRALDNALSTLKSKTEQSEAEKA